MGDALLSQTGAGTGAMNTRGAMNARSLDRSHAAALHRGARAALRALLLSVSVGAACAAPTPPAQARTASAPAPALTPAPAPAAAPTPTPTATAAPARRFTPNLTWEQLLRLPKLWGVAWASTRAWDNDVVYFDRIRLVPPLKPQYLAQYHGFLRRARAGEAEFRAGACYPDGVPRSAWYSYAPAFLFRPGNSLLITSFGETREIFMDGRPHPAHPDTSDPAIAYLGHSIGWWEGDTLVVDTVGFAPQHELFYDVPNGGGMHVIERYRLLSPTRLHLVLTVEDPDRLERPWVVTRTYVTADDADATIAGTPDLIETQLCRPGQGREQLDQNGNGTVDLTPPPRGAGIGAAPAPSSAP